MSEGFEQGVDALNGAQLADIDEFGRVGVRRGLDKIGGAQAVDDDAAQTRRRADFGVETPLDEAALEQKGVGQRGEQPLDRHVEAMGGRARLVIEAAAVRRIGAHGMRG